MRRTLLLAASIAAGFLNASLFAADLTIQIDAAKEGAKINPRFYGIFLEEINHGVDGGLYAEMIQNRAFEDAKAPEGFTYQTAEQVAAAAAAAREARGRGRGRGGAPAPSGFRGTDSKGGRWVDPGLYATTFVWDADKSLPYWSLITEGGASAAMSLDQSNPLHENSPRCCKFEITSLPANGRAAIANAGFCARPGASAVGVQQGEKYEVSFFVRAQAFAGPVTVSVEGPDGPVTNLATIQIVDGAIPDGRSQWAQYKATLIAAKTESQGRFVLAAGSTGTLWLDFVSLFPAKTFKDRPNGMRSDIAQMLADLKPGFVRFPGGCVVEAATVETAYNWKDTVGPLEGRKEVWNAWDYRRTHGMGLYEYMQFIEDLGAQPMYVAFAGQTCIYRAPEVVPMEQMQPIVQSYLDLVEYANGPANSQWGKLRAQAGHAAPFNLQMIEIGNENTGQAYTQRYNLIFNALKEKYPGIQTIADLPLRGSKVEMIDDHHYHDPNWFFNNTHTFDNRDRSAPPLYLGETAVTSGRGVGPERGNLLAALAEGAFLMGAERNADVVKMVSYAPLLGHVNGRTELAGAPPPWHAMIYFDSLHSFGTVSYYLWKTLGVNVPSVNLSTTLTEAHAQTGIPGNVGVGTWGTQAEYKDFKVEGKDGKVLYAGDFAKGSDGWTTEGGRWSITDGAYRQGANQNGFAYVGDETWTDYTLTTKARKIAGGEGFLIIFGHKGGDRYWWNIGAYGNTRHEIEMNQAVIGRAVDGTIESDKWYDIKLQVEGQHVRAWLNGELVHDIQLPQPPGPVSAIAGRDDATGEIILKVINRGAEPHTATLDLAGVAAVEPKAKAVVLSSSALTDNNTMDQPHKIMPKESEVTVSGPKFDHEFPAYSLTVLRVKPRK